jgi:outer membrane immunogenic protein
MASSSGAAKSASTTKWAGSSSGVEGDIDGIANDNKGGAAVIVPGLGPVAVTTGNSWVSSLAARFGVTNGNWLFYGTAGGGWVNSSDITVTNLTTGVSLTGEGRSSSAGLFGVGFEYAFGNNWTAKFEYDPLSLGSRSYRLKSALIG